MDIREEVLCGPPFSPLVLADPFDEPESAFGQGVFPRVAVALEFAATKIDYLLVYARKAKPYIKPDVFRTLRDELLDEMAERVWDSGSFAEQVIAIWDSRFTHEEIKELIAFYESDVGRKLVVLSAEIGKDQRTAGRIWGQEMEAIIADRVRAKLGELEKSYKH